MGVPPPAFGISASLESSRDVAGMPNTTEILLLQPELYCKQILRLPSFLYNSACQHLHDGAKRVSL